MAKKFLTGLTLVNLDSDPLSGLEGELYFNTSASVAKIYKSGEWSELGGGASTITVSDTAPASPNVGDAWYDNTSNSFSVWDGTYWVEVTSVVGLTQEEVQDYAAPLLNHSNHTNISASYDDVNNQILLSASASFTTEEIQDAIAPLFEHSNHTNITASYDDLNNEILLSTSASVTTEQIQDSIAPLFTHSNHTNIAVSYDDLNNEILISASPSYTDENAMDAVAGMITSGTHTNISVSYNDGLNTLSFTAAPGYTDEEAVDAVAAALASASSTSINVTYDDSSGQILLEVGDVGSGITVGNTAPVSPSVGDGWYNNETGVFAIYDGTYWVDVNGVVTITDEQAQDAVAPLLDHANHTNITATYDDANNQIILNTSASITNIDSIVYPDYIVFDTTPETSSASVGTVYWDSGDGLPKAILSAATELGIGQESVALVKNATGSTIAKGKVVYINGAQGQRPTIALASSASEVTSSKTFGFVAEELLDEAEGFLVTEGILRGIDTDGLTEGGAVWLSSSGNYTQTMPTQPDHGVFLGYVVKANPSSGEIFVKIQNGYELNELHNVLINGVSDNQALVYNSSASLWQNESLVNSLSGTANEINVSASVGNITIGLPDDVTISNDLTVLGNLTVSGSTTTLNTTELNVEDNIITLNYGVSGSPSLNAGIEVERGSSDNVQIRWNESLDVWEFTNDGTTYSELGSGSGALYQAEAPVGAEIGTIWVDSNASAGIINSNDFVLKSEAEAYTPHGFLLMGG